MAKLTLPAYQVMAGAHFASSMESGRGCPLWLRVLHGNRLFLGDSIRFRTNESVVNELLLFEARARREGGQIAVLLHRRLISPSTSNAPNPAARHYRRWPQVALVAQIAPIVAR